MTNRLVTASMPSRPKAKKKKEGKVETLNINVITNGFTAYCRHESKSGMYEEPDEIAFTGPTAVEDVVAYVRQQLTGAAPADGAAAPADAFREGDAY